MFQTSGHTHESKYTGYRDTIMINFIDATFLLLQREKAETNHQIVFSFSTLPLCRMWIRAFARISEK